MPAPLSDLSSSSISSSGHSDGLGWRSLAFDRETGGMLERVHVRPELAVFEQILRDRVRRLEGLESDRFARPLSVEREASTGDLCVLAEFITGTRLSELLEVSADAAVVPGVDVALGYLLETLPALSTLHTTARAVHGLIDPSRTVVTAEGRVVLLDVAFGAVVELLHPSIERLWSEFGVASLARDDRFNAVGDITQTGLNAMMLVLGRGLRSHEFPDAIPSLLMEVIEVAHIRGSTAFANGLQRFLQRSLPLPGRRPFTTAAEALDDVNQLVRREIGAEICRQAIADFVAQMDAAFAQATERAAAEEARELNARRVPAPLAPELNSFLDSFETVDEPSGASRDRHEPEAAAFSVDEGEDEGLEISLDHLDADAADPPAITDRGRQQQREEGVEVYDLLGLDDFSSANGGALSSELKAFEDRAVPPAASPEPEPIATTTPAPGPVPESVSAPARTAALEPPLEARPSQVAAASEFFAAAPPPAAPAEAPAAATGDSEVVAAGAADDDEESQEVQDAATHADRTQGSSRRRKRQQQKSARARKDKLRSTTADQKGPSAAPPPPPPRPASPSGWLVSPQRAAASESLIPPPVQAPPPQPAMPSFSPAPVGMFPQPTYANSAPPSIYGTPTAVKPAPPPAPPPPPAPLPPPIATVQPSSMATVRPSSVGAVQSSTMATVQPSSAGGALQPPARVPLKLKEEPPAAAAPRRTIPEPIVPPPDRFGTLSFGGAAQEEPKGFPWKLAAIAVGVAIIAIVMGRSYLPGRLAVEGEPGAPSDTASTAPPAHALPNDDSPIPAGKGRVLVQTQPAGIKVMVDRKSAGETPLRLDLPPGRRALTFLTSGGEVTQTVRVVAGKTVTLDIPVFSGWVSVVAPFVLDITEDGRGLGTTEQNRIMLPPGRHKLTFSHKEYGYSSTQDVDVEPGGVRTVTVDPKGTAALNATPWAEVWLDGAKLGETPLASAQVPLGTHEFVFKHPELGERRVTATIRANGPATVAADFTK